MMLIAVSSNYDRIRFKSYVNAVQYMRAAIWTDIISDFRSEGEIRSFIDWCSKIGIKMILPCINHGTGTVCYESRLVPLARNCVGWDPLGLVVERAHERGMEVHPWVVVANWGSNLLPYLRGREYSEAGPPPLQVSHPEYFAVDAYGYSMLEAPSMVHSAGGSCYLDLGKETVRNFVLDLVKELMKEYPHMDGIHLDYIRYQYFKSGIQMDLTQAREFGRLIKEGDQIWIMRKWEQNPSLYDARFVFRVADKKVSEGSQTMQIEREYSYCYCDNCLEEFQTRYSVAIPYQLRNTYERAQWIASNAKAKWNEWRASNVTSLVAGIRKILSETSPPIKLSAATFWNYTSARELVAQDWISWIAKGLLDFVNPMTYWIDPEKVGEALRAYRKLLKDDKFPIYPGLLTSSEYRITKENLPAYFEAIKAGRGSGVTLFAYSLWSSEYRKARSLPAIDDYDGILSNLIRERTS